MRWRSDGPVALVATAEALMLGDGAEARVAAAIAEGVEVCERMVS
jgi:hypothetical protein